MKNKIILHNNKTLKLSNILIKEIDKDDFQNFVRIFELMDNYIKSKSVQPIGPLIQYTTASVDEEGQLELKIKLMRQCSNFINNVEEPYKMQSVTRVKDCMYVRYTGPESKIKYAYDKINLTAFEEDIELKGDSYTVFVNQIDDNIVADIFMERAKDE